MSFRAARTICVRELKIALRDKPGLISSIARSVLWLVVFGGGFGAARFAGLGVDYEAFLFPGIVAMSLQFTSMRSGISVIWDREFGFLKEILVSPATRISIMAGKVMGASTTAVLEGMVILLLAPLIGVQLTATKIVATMLLMFLISLTLVSIGLIISAVMKTFEGFQTIMTFLIMPMFFLSGAIFPLDKIPAWMSILTKINPLTYGVDAIRITVIGVGQNPLALDVAVITLTAALTMLAGAQAFNKTE